MNIYLLSQKTKGNSNNKILNSMVTAPSFAVAKKINPINLKYPDSNWNMAGMWADSPDNIECELIGKTVGDFSFKGTLIAH